MHNGQNYTATRVVHVAAIPPRTAPRQRVQERASKIITACLGTLYVDVVSLFTIRSKGLEQRTSAWPPLHGARTTSLPMGGQNNSETLSDRRGSQGDLGSNLRGLPLETLNQVPPGTRSRYWGKPLESNVTTQPAADLERNSVTDSIPHDLRKKKRNGTLQRCRHTRQPACCASDGKDLLCDLTCGQRQTEEEQAYRYS